MHMVCRASLVSAELVQAVAWYQGRLITFQRGMLGSYQLLYKQTQALGSHASVQGPSCALGSFLRSSFELQLFSFHSFKLQPLGLHLSSSDGWS